MDPEPEIIISFLSLCLLLSQLYTAEWNYDIRNQVLDSGGVVTLAGGSQTTFPSLDRPQEAEIPPNCTVGPPFKHFQLHTVWEFVASLRWQQNPFQPSVSIPRHLWSHIFTNFVTGLPNSEGYTTILMVVERFSKMIHFVTLPKLPFVKETADWSYSTCSCFTDSPEHFPVYW